MGDLSGWILHDLTDKPWVTSWMIQRVQSNTGLPDYPIIPDWDRHDP